MDSNEQKRALERRILFSGASGEGLPSTDGRWKLAILYHLFRSEPTPLRFSELERLTPNVSQRMLTIELRSLERHGIVRRDVFAEVPPRVQCSDIFRPRTKPGAARAPAMGRQEATLPSAEARLNGRYAVIILRNIDCLDVYLYSRGYAKAEERRKAKRDP